MIVRTALFVFGCFMVAAPLSAQHSSPMREVILEHYTRYPAMEPQDLYKFLYQAAMGNEHLMNDTVGIRQYLAREMRSITASSSEPLIERLTADSALVRLNLRSFKAKGGDQRILIEAMLRTAANFKKNPLLLHAFWNVAESLAVDGAIPHSPDSLRLYFKTMETKGFPVVHHSASFENAYHPAYRLLMRAYLPR